MRQIALCAATLFWGSFVFADPMAVKVLPNEVTARNYAGDRACTISGGSGYSAIARDGDRIELSGINSNNPKCPARAFVYAQFLVPQKTNYPISTTVNASELALRGKPTMDSRYLCGLQEGTHVQVESAVANATVSKTWVKVKVTGGDPSCPDEGYVNANYLKASNAFDGLPAVDDSDTSVSDNHTSECKTCNVKTTDQKNVQDLRNIIEKIKVIPTDGSYLDGLRQLVADPSSHPTGMNLSRSSRHLVQMKLEGRSSGPCGSLHYNAHSPPGSNDYASPLANCALSAALMNWKQNFCPDSNAGCRIAVGDISNKDVKYYDGHASHQDGNCADIRPLRKGNFQDAGLNYKNSEYDQDMTLKMIDVFRDAGANHILYNDPDADTERHSGHGNHLHVCFYPSKNHDGKAEQTCNNFLKPENSAAVIKTCPELQ